MTRVKTTRGAAPWLLSILFPVCSLLALQPAYAAKPHAHAAHRVAARHAPAPRKAHVVQAHRVHARFVAAHHEAGKKKVLAATVRHAAVAQRAQPAMDPNAPLRLTANVAYVMDPKTGQVLLGKNEGLVHPIASLTKLMTGMIIAEAHLPMDEKIVITDDDVDRLKFSSSRLPVGTELTRAQTLHLALMASENRAAHALARTYPGGESAFVSAMNIKAQQLGMLQTHYIEPTGLSPENESTAHDLALLAQAASEEPVLREYTTSPAYQIASGRRSVHFINTNRLVRGGTWDIFLQKTGYIKEAGECMLMQAQVAGRKLIMVFLDSASSLARARDAERVRAWLRAHPGMTATADEGPRS